MILKHNAELAGRVKLQISGGERGTIDYDWFDNMILDQGLRRLLGPSEPYGSHVPFFTFGVGSSSVAVSPSDTGLLQPLAFVNAVQQPQSGWDETGGFGWSRRSASFPRGAAAGNISELTSSWQPNNASAFARTLVKDSSGNPTTITVLSDEVLTITWEFRRWWIVSAPHVINFLRDGVELSTTVSYLSISQMSKSSSVLGGFGITADNWQLRSDFTAEKTRTFTESQGNPEISTVNPPTGGGNPTPVFPNQFYYATFTPPIPKTNEFTCRITWELTLTRRAP